MTIWTPDRKLLSSPLHVSLAAAMKDAITDGRLPAGTRLLPHRTLADILGISVHTVSKSYDALKRNGVIESQVGRGTYVVDSTSRSSQPFLLKRDDGGVIDLSLSRSLYDKFHVEKMQNGLSHLHEELDPDVYLACRPNVGLQAHCESGVKWLARCGLDVSEQSIVMTNGATQGVAMAMSAAAQQGDLIVTDLITHHQFIFLSSYLGIRLQGLAMDKEGILPEAFESICRQTDVKAIVTTPTISGPTVALMPAERREKIIEIARQYNVLIIEDDVLGPLMEDRLAPLSSLAPERSLYVTSFSKCTIPGLRAGYLVVPDNLMSAVTGRLIAFNWMATPMVTELASRWIDDGTADEMVLWQRKAIAGRFGIVKEVMQGLDWCGHSSALHFWLQLPDEWNPYSFVEHARARGVAITLPTPFMTKQCDKANAVRVSVGGDNSASRFREGLLILRDMLSRTPEPIAQAL